MNFCLKVLNIFKKIILVNSVRVSVQSPSDGCSADSGNDRISVVQNLQKSWRCEINSEIRRYMFSRGETADRGGS